MEEIHALPGHLIRRLHQISVAIFVEELQAAGFDLTPVQYAALSTIQSNPSIDQATLAGLIAHDRTTISGVIDRLERRGLVARSVSAKDRRARVLELTPAGAATLSIARPVVRRAQDEMLRDLSPSERDAFMRMLKKVTTTANDRARAPFRAPEGD